MILYLMPGACSLATHIALVWADAEYTVKRLTRETVRGAAFRTINPKGVVPALRLDDGAILTESLAILEYIANRYPAARMGLQPDDLLGRARLDEALAELVSDVHMAWSPIMVPERYVTLESNQADAKQAALAQLHVHYSRLDDLMRDRTWMLFDRRTVADAYLYVMCSWQARTPTPLTAYPALNKYKTRLDLDPGVQRALREERGTELMDQLELPAGALAAAS
ncbi:MAG: glutathione S-transferase N-terminal domain-containing protein [Kofleriaceae bacterium]